MTYDQLLTAWKASRERYEAARKTGDKAAISRAKQAEKRAFGRLVNCTDPMPVAEDELFAWRELLILEDYCDRPF